MVNIVLSFSGLASCLIDRSGCCRGRRAPTLFVYSYSVLEKIIYDGPLLAAMPQALTVRRLTMTLYQRTGVERLCHREDAVWPAWAWRRGRVWLLRLPSLVIMSSDNSAGG